jgi:PAS domain S-box-containing protein
LKEPPISTDDRGIVTRTTGSETTGWEWTSRQTALAALLTAGAYWIGARLGLALTFGPSPVAALWPPNAVLLAALLVAPVSAWWLILLSVLPVHLLVELRGGVPLVMVLCWFVSNCFEAVLGAWLVRHLLPGRVRLNTTHSFGVFVVCATFLATFLSSFLDAAFVSWNGWGESSYWAVWRIRFLSNVLATQTIVPVVLAVDPQLLTDIRRAPARRQFEGVCLAVALSLVCLAAFWLPDGQWPIGPALLYAPIPLLLWAAVSFGPLGISLCFGIVSFLAIWGALRGVGPFTALAPDQNTLSLQLFLFLTGVPLALLATTTEERRLAERKAAESERLLSLTIKTAHIGVWSADLQSGRFTGDEVFTEMTGQTAPQGRAYIGLIEEVPTGPSLAEGGEPATSTSAEHLIPERELQVQHPGGSVRWILARGMVLRRPDGTPFRVMGIAIDISERKRIEQAMREHDERMSLAATTADIGFWSYELRTGEVWLSDHCYTMLGIVPGTNPTEVLERLVPQSSIGEIAARIESTFARGGTLVDESRIRRPDGTERWLASSARLERETTGHPLRIIGVSRDITEQRMAEREADERRLALAHLARVATVGELTATIVHEVGQPIGAIMLNAQAAQRLASDPAIDVEELRTVLGDLLRDARRAGGVIGQLRVLLRRDELAREPLDLRAVVQGALDLARGELVKQNIELIVSMPNDTLHVLANRAQLQQVLLNLILNARDAITAASPVRRQLQVTVTKDVDSVVSVWVADSGGGIAREHLAHVFEPFFTSKSHGLGLGLAVSRSIMLDHGGDLRAENVDGGAVLKLVLPEFRVRPPPRSPGSELHGLAHPPQYQPPASS